jgi:pimeloyl-ACP methyl ester carboxylesterase
MTTLHFRPRLLALAAAAAFLLPSTPALAASYDITSYSFPLNNVNAVTLTISAPTQAQVIRSTVRHNGKNITSLFVPVPGTTTMTATVPNLSAGLNTLQLYENKMALTPLANLSVYLSSADDCNSAKLGTSIEPGLIGEPVSGVNLTATNWVNATGSNQAHCRVNGNMTPVDPAAPNINFGVTLPARYAYRYAQMGGGGMNGSVPGLAGAVYNNRGMATAGSDSGHGFGPNTWALNDEAMKNLGYMQMKKTYDAAQVLQQRAYGALPTYRYWFGNSQGGREGLTVAQRYPDHYDGVSVQVPIVNFSTLMLAPVLLRIEEIALDRWVTQAKRTAISAEFIRQCDGFDGLLDGVMNNYPACRALFDVKQHPPGYNPWASKRCPDGIDPDPADTSASACFTDGQIETLKFTYSPYLFATPLVNNNPQFGMWMPMTDPGGSGLIQGSRFRGQEGAAKDAPIYTHLGIAGVTGFLFQDLNVNPLDYVEGGALNDRRVEISQYLDATNPDLSAFRNAGGKLIATIGTNDSLASPGAQLDYYQSVLNTMGRETVDSFARLWVLPQTGHGLSGSSFNLNGAGEPNQTFSIPNGNDRTGMLFNWVEKGIAPEMAPVATAGARSLPMCSYPTYPRYLGGELPVTEAASYTCATHAPTKDSKGAKGPGSPSSRPLAGTR